MLIHGQNSEETGAANGSVLVGEGLGCIKTGSERAVADAQSVKVVFQNLL